MRMIDLDLRLLPTSRRIPPLPSMRHVDPSNKTLEGYDVLLHRFGYIQPMINTAHYHQWQLAKSHRAIVRTIPLQMAIQGMASSIGDSVNGYSDAFRELVAAFAVASLPSGRKRKKSRKSGLALAPPPISEGFAASEPEKGRGGRKKKRDSLEPLMAAIEAPSPPIGVSCLFVCLLCFSSYVWSISFFPNRSSWLKVHALNLEASKRVAPPHLYLRQHWRSRSHQSFCLLASSHMQAWRCNHQVPEKR